MDEKKWQPAVIRPREQWCLVAIEQSRLKHWNDKFVGMLIHVRPRTTYEGDCLLLSVRPDYTRKYRPDVDSTYVHECQITTD